MNRWAERWQMRQTAWDLGGSHPLTQSCLQDASSLSGTSLAGPWLIPGCGRAHDAVTLLENGATSVCGIDYVPMAIAEASRLYAGRPQIVLQCRDVFLVPQAERYYYWGVFDRAMMCAVNGIERHRYLDAVVQYLRPGGMFISIAFAAVAKPESGPPFEISRSELLTSFSAGWRILQIEEVVSPACDQKILKEWRFIAQKQSV
jgi:hypothetical protein